MTTIESATVSRCAPGVRAEDKALLHVGKARHLAAKRVTVADPDAHPPWSPLSVTLIALFFPAGGAILTIRNLHRMKQLDGTAARRLYIAAAAILVAGYTTLFMFAPYNAHKGPQPDIGPTVLLGCGIALASYSAQRGAFRAWKLAHHSSRLSGWAWAVLLGIVYEVAVLFASIVLYQIGAGTGIFHQSGA